MDVPFHTLDVFTERVFGGNPLGVVPDARALDTETMQRIARELNLSETIFLSRPETPEGTRRARIFTPALEVPFAGHPTVGAAWSLAAGGEIQLPDSGGEIVLEENVGPVTVRVDMADGAPVEARFATAVAPEHREVVWTGRQLAHMLSLPAGAVSHGPDLAPEMVSAGLPFVIVPVRDLDAARESRLDIAIWQELTAEAWSRMICVVSTDTEAPDADLHVRMYAPGAGVPEDPATGSAAAALAAYFGRRAALSEEGGRAASRTLRWVIEQGLEMGRPSRIEAAADVEEGRVVAVRVGGCAVRVSSGVMHVPEAGAA